MPCQDDLVAPIRKHHDCTPQNHAQSWCFHCYLDLHRTGGGLQIPLLTYSILFVCIRSRVWFYITPRIVAQCFLRSNYVDLVMSLHHAVGYHTRTTQRITTYSTHNGFFRSGILCIFCMGTSYKRYLISRFYFCVVFIVDCRPPTPGSVPRDSESGHHARRSIA